MCRISISQRDTIQRKPFSEISIKQICVTKELVYLSNCEFKLFSLKFFWFRINFYRYWIIFYFFQSYTIFWIKSGHYGYSDKRGRVCRCISSLASELLAFAWRKGQNEGCKVRQRPVSSRSFLATWVSQGKKCRMHQGSKRLHNMTAKLVVLLTKSEVTHGMIDALGMFKFLHRTLFPLPNSGSQKTCLMLVSAWPCNLHFDLFFKQRPATHSITRLEMKCAVQYGQNAKQ